MNAAQSPNAETNDELDRLGEPSLLWRLTKWVLGVFVFAAIVGSYAAHIPQPAKKLVLVAAGCGLVVGWLTVWWGAACGMRLRFLLIAAAVILSAGAFALCSGHSHRLLREAGKAALKKDPQAALALEIERQAEANGAAAGSLRRTYDPTFKDYLALRVSGFGDWSTPWPELFWAGELVVAGAAGGWMAERRSRGT